MSAKTRILKLVTVVCLMFLSLILLLNIYDNGNSFYYLPREKQQNEISINSQTEMRKLLLAPSIEPTDAELALALQRELPNVPFAYWRRYEKKVLQVNATCAKFPSPLHLEFHNNNWQSYRTDNISIKLFAAYYDKRISLPQGPLVRLLVMSNQSGGVYPRNYCQLWFDNSTKPLIVPVKEYISIWPKAWGNSKNHYYPHLLSCIVPNDGKVLIPQTVSLVSEECAHATNSLKVNFDEPGRNETKNRFGICIKGLDYPYTDKSARLVEWLELMRILGVHKVFAYNLAVHPNITKVLDYYQEQGFVELSPLSLARGEPGLPNYQHMVLRLLQLNKRLNEIIPYNDCFYRNMYKYDYLAAVDIDEVIMPLGNLTSWNDLVDVAERLNSEKCPYGHSSICFRNAYFPASTDNNSTETPNDYLYMLDHVERVTQISAVGKATKCFHNTTEAVTLHNHFSLSWLKSCRPMTIETDFGQMQHYRDSDKMKKKDKTKPEDFENFVEDANIWRFKPALELSTRRVLQQLGFLSIG